MPDILGSVENQWSKVVAMKNRACAFEFQNNNANLAVMMRQCMPHLLSHIHFFKPSIINNKTTKHDTIQKREHIVWIDVCRLVAMVMVIGVYYQPLPLRGGHVECLRHILLFRRILRLSAPRSFHEARHWHVYGQDTSRGRRVFRRRLCRHLHGIQCRCCRP